MVLSRLVVKGLFNQFDYDISFDNPEHLSIITGPNGYGKTKLLNIIFACHQRDFNFFNALVFQSFFIHFVHGDTLSVTKRADGSLETVFINDRGEKFASVTPPDILLFPISEYNLPIQGVYFIREQRLLITFPDNSGGVIVKIEQLPLVLKQIFEIFSYELLNLSQELDSSFPRRLLSSTNSLSVGDFEKGFRALQLKQEKLKLYNFTARAQEMPSYSGPDAKALSVYLNDSEKKVAVFDDLVQKLDTFTTILNERRFAFKTVKIDREKGFYFQTENGEPLELTDLSSGEQHEVVLLFELIFMAKPGTIVLIDEPELSLHVTWQRAFIADLLEIMKFQDIQVIVATHSPQIINDRWDLVYNLEKQPA